MALPEDILEKLRRVMMVAPAVANPYGLLKSRLVELLTPSVMERLNIIIWQPELGGRRPSELMEALLALLPPGEQPGLLFKGHFLHHLPSDMRDREALEILTLEPRALAALVNLSGTYVCNLTALVLIFSYISMHGSGSVCQIRIHKAL